MADSLPIRPPKCPPCHRNTVRHAVGTVSAIGSESCPSWAGTRNAYTNTVESYFNILKKGITGIYHSVSKKHLHRYLAEFEFRYNLRDLRDGERVIAAIEAADGKRLRYRDPVDSKGMTRPTQLDPHF